MANKLIYAIAVIAAIVSGAQTVLAQPMRCSGEMKTCLATCPRPPHAEAAVCITNCRTRQSICMQTGCWDNGFRKYCGLTRQ